MSWTIDSTHTHVGFSVKHMMVTTVRGQFKTYTGKVNLDRTDFTKSTFDGEVDVTSIDTGVVDRDNHLRSNDFFDAQNHPKMTFKSTRIEGKNDSEYIVHGDLTIRGVTRPIALDVEYGGTRKSPYGKTVVGISAHGSVNRKDFGLNWNAVLEAGGVMVAEKVKIEVELEAASAE